MRSHVMIIQPNIEEHPHKTLAVNKLKAGLENRLKLVEEVKYVQNVIYQSYRCLEAHEARVTSLAQKMLTDQITEIMQILPRGGKRFLLIRCHVSSVKNSKLQMKRLSNCLAEEKTVIYPYTWLTVFECWAHIMVLINEILIVSNIIINPKCECYIHGVWC